MLKGKGVWPGEGGTYFLYFSEELAFLGSFEVSAPVLKTHKQSLTGKARVPG